MKKSFLAMSLLIAGVFSMTGILSALSAAAGELSKEDMEWAGKCVSLCKKQVVNAAYKASGEYGSKDGANIDVLAVSRDQSTEVLAEVDFSDSETMRMLVHFSVYKEKCRIGMTDTFAFER